MIAQRMQSQPQQADNRCCHCCSTLKTKQAQACSTHLSVAHLLQPCIHILVIRALLREGHRGWKRWQGLQ